MIHHIIHIITRIKYWYFVIAIFNSILLNAQNLFNKHYGIDSGYYAFSSVVEHNNKIFVLTHSNSPSLNNIYGTSGIIQFDMEGNIIKSDSISPESRYFYAWPKNLKVLNDSMLYFTCQDTGYSHIITYNIHSGKFSPTSIKSQLGKRIFLYSYGLITRDSSMYLLTNHNVRIKQIGTGYFGIYDLTINKINSSGVTRSKIISNEYNDIIGYNILELNNGNIAIVGFTSDFEYDGQADYFFQQFIYVYDSDLNLIKKIKSPMSKKLYEISDMLVAPDGSMYCASASLIWHNRFPAYGYYDNIPAITKYDSSGNYVWTKTYVPLVELTNSDIYNSLSFDRDSTHIIAAGKYHILDTIVNDSLRYVTKGLITKINLNGNLIWNRTFLARGNEESWNLNDIYDIQRLSTGGYLLCGESDMSEYKQDRTLHGWLLKLDEEGCLIPGCHLVGIENSKENADVKIYPNPANQFVSIIHGYNKVLNLEILNTLGQTIKKISKIIPLETNIFSVEDLPKGEYLFLFMDSNKVNTFSKKVIIN